MQPIYTTVIKYTKTNISYIFITQSENKYSQIKIITLAGTLLS
jgi:hypothetical protein